MASRELLREGGFTRIFFALGHFNLCNPFSFFVLPSATGSLWLSPTVKRENQIEMLGVLARQNRKGNSIIAKQSYITGLAQFKQERYAAVICCGSQRSMTYYQAVVRVC